MPVFFFITCTQKVSGICILAFVSSTSQYSLPNLMVFFGSPVIPMKAFYTRVGLGPLIAT